MTTTEQRIERMERTIKLMGRILDNMAGADFEEVDAMSRAIRDLDSELFDLKLSLQPEAEELMYA